MTFRIFKSGPAGPGALIALLGLASLLGGCAAPGTSDSAVTGIVVGSVGRPTPPGIEPAYIVGINGEPVTWSQTGHRLAPGTHVIRVVPRVEGPTHQVPSAEALATRWENSPVTVEVKAGHTYVIGLVMPERLEMAGRRGRWEAVLVSETRNPR